MGRIIGGLAFASVTVFAFVSLAAWVLSAATGYLHQDFPAVPDLTLYQGFSVWAIAAILLSPVTMAGRSGS